MSDKKEIEIFQAIEKIIQHYRTQDYNTLDGNRVINAARKLSGYMYSAEALRVAIFDAWTKKVNELVKEGESVSSAEKKADEIYPIYKYRRLLNICYETHRLMISHVSWLKQEKDLNKNEK